MGIIIYIIVLDTSDLSFYFYNMKIVKMFEIVFSFNVKDNKFNSMFTL